MIQRPIMDAGPGLNFFSLHQERLLFSTVGALSVPEAVQTEILRKARQDHRFAPAERVWKKLPTRLMTVLSDDTTRELAAAVHRISGVTVEHRSRTSKDLGETMVIAHAVVAAEAAQDVVILLDDNEGGKLVALEAARIRRLRGAGRSAGSIQLIHTTTVLERAAGTRFIPDKNAMRKLYERLQALDDGLPPIEYTNLLATSLWSQ